MTCRQIMSVIRVTQLQPKGVCTFRLADHRIDRAIPVGSTRLFQRCPMFLYPTLYGIRQGHPGRSHPDAQLARHRIHGRDTTVQSPTPFPARDSPSRLT